jgi:hypothetical protein
MTDRLNPKTARLTLMRTATQRAALLATVIAAGYLIAACGSSSTGSSSKTTASSGSSSSGTGPGANATLAACLHKHGVSFTAGGGAPGGGTPPSGAPGSGGPASAGSTTGGPPPGVPGSRAGGSKFQAALKACGAKLPSGAAPRSTGFSRGAIQKYVSCVRQHGYKLLNPNLSGTGPVFPSSIRSNAKFQAASRSCQGLLAPASGTGGPGSS